MEFLVGQSVKGYEILERVGKGGFGEVYRARHAAVDREVAVKVILPQYANQPDFIRRFEAEAQLVARLEHMNIVPLFDYWRGADGAYLVMRWLRGGSLRNRLRQGPIPLNIALQLVSQITEALTVAHRNGVVHRDLKPDNILLDEDSNAYLADFGIAKDVNLAEDDEEDTLLGSPAYLSPEQWGGQDLTPKCDIYSLGIVLYESLVGKSPYPANISPSELLNKHLYEPLPELLSPLPEQLNAVIQKATAKDPEDRYEDARSLAVAFRKAMDADVPAVETYSESQFDTQFDDLHDTETVLYRGVHTAELENPYKGLRAFQEADANDFFGRQQLIDQLLARLQEDGPDSRFLAVLGPSGSGKSSVVRAGVIPALRGGVLEGMERAFIVQMFPGTNPLEELEAALLRVAVNPPPSLIEQLRSDERGLLRAVRRILPEDESTELVIVIDQFEEVFTLVEDEGERLHFLESILTAVQAPRSRLWVIITLRADFYDRPLLYPAFGELLRRRVETVLPLSAGEIEEAIKGPAARIGAVVENDLIPRIVKDVSEQPGALPLLQYALTELFERREGRTMTLAAYQDIGGVLGALARRADDTYDHLADGAKEGARQLFLRLVTLGEGTEDTRRRVEQRELSVLEEDHLQDVIDAFGAARLLTFDRHPVTRGPTIEVAHEALIRQWGKLRDWLHTSREDLRLHRRLMSEVAEWSNSARESGLLTGGMRLEQYEIWMNSTDIALNQDERAYLEQSLKKRERLQEQELERKAHEARIARQAQNFGRAAAVLGVFVVLAVAATIFAAITARQAVDQVAEVEQTLTPIPLTLTPFKATLDGGRTQIARAESAAVEAGQTLTSVPPTMTTVAEQISDGERHIEALRLAGEAVKIILENGNVELAGLLSIRSLHLDYSTIAETQLNVVLGHLRTTTLIKHDSVVTAVALSTDDSLLLTGTDEGAVQLWNVRTGALVRAFEGFTVRVSDVAYSPDGRYLAASGYDASVRLWNADDGRPVGLFWTGSAVIRFAFSPDGTLLATANANGTATVWDVGSAEKIYTLTGHAEWVHSVAFSPDSQTLATASADRTVRLWDLETGDEIISVGGHTDAVTAVAFAPDGRTVASGSINGEVLVMDAITGEIRDVFIGHLNVISGIEYSPGGEVMMTVGQDSVVRLWDVATGANYQTLSGHVAPILAGDFSDGGSLVVTGGQDHTARVWDITPSYPVSVLLQSPGIIRSVDFSKDMRLALVGNVDGLTQVWDLEEGEVLWTLRGHTGIVTRVALSPDETIFATGSSDNTVRVWDASSGDLLYVVSDPDRRWAVDLEFFPDGERFAISYAIGTPIIVNTETGEVVDTWGETPEQILQLAISPDGSHMATGGDEGMVRIWDVTKKELLFRMYGHTMRIGSLEYSEDGQYLLSGSMDMDARLWDATTGELLLTLGGHEGWVSVAFSVDMQMIATSSNNSIRLWDIKTGEKLRTITSPISRNISLTTDPGGKYLVTSNEDGTVRRWYLETDDLIEAVCSKLLLDFTENERRTFGITDSESTCT